MVWMTDEKDEGHSGDILQNNLNVRQAIYCLLLQFIDDMDVFFGMFGGGMTGQ